jgi:hypothetical protein
MRRFSILKSSNIDRSKLYVGPPWREYTSLGESFAAWGTTVVSPKLLESDPSTGTYHQKHITTWIKESWISPRLSSL